MSDLVVQSTSLLPSVSAESEPDTFTLNLQALFRQHEQALKTIEAQRLEIERLTEELRRLRAGHGIEVMIDGQRYLLAVSPASNGHKSGVEDSFVL